MPSYTFKNKTTGEVWDETLTMSEREERLKDPNIEQLITGINISYAGGTKKPDSGFRDVLKKIKSNNIRSNINTF